MLAISPPACAFHLNLTGWCFAVHLGCSQLRCTARLVARILERTPLLARHISLFTGAIGKWDWCSSAEVKAGVPVGLRDSLPNP